MNGRVRSLLGWGRLGLLALLWGSTFLWIELALTGLSPLQVTVARCALGALVLTAACYGTGRRLPRGRGVWGRLVVAAFFCNALPFALFGLGQQTVDSGQAGVLNATTPLWSLALGLVTGAERPLRPVRLAGLLLGFGGTVVIFAPWQRSGSLGWGALAVLAAAASYAVAFGYMSRTLVGKGIPTLSLSAAQLICATGLAALALPADGLPPVRADRTALIAVVVLGVLATGLTFHLTYRIIADEGATDAAAVGYLLPVVSLALGAVVLGEDVGLRVGAGMAVVLAGVGMTRRGGGRPPGPAAGAAAGSATAVGAR
ncbi:DMT family transporter [Streptomyces glaucus]|uniref:DMT family transporter n=1 Tax=Streptomyces glaucus TaxID=284029 RepID=A0ABN3JH62_9ACTN